jgi:hypothetical protein
MGFAVLRSGQWRSRDWHKPMLLAVLRSQKITKASPSTPRRDCAPVEAI